MESSKSRRKALILVDLQNDFIDGGALAVPEGRATVDIANSLLLCFDLVVATQDWHPANHLSFASQHAGFEVGRQFVLNGLPQTAWPDHCIQGSRGAEFVKDLKCECIDRVFRKGIDRDVDSYSGFFDNGKKNSTGLADYLHEQKIGHVAVMGLATDYCVKFTAIDAIEQGFRTSLIVDGCRGVNLQLGDVEKALAEMVRLGIELTESKSFLKD